jgi:hypothetical protein
VRGRLVLFARVAVQPILQEHFERAQCRCAPAARKTVEGGAESSISHSATSASTQSGKTSACNPSKDCVQETRRAGLATGG